MREYSEISLFVKLFFYLKIHALYYSDSLSGYSVPGDALRSVSCCAFSQKNGRIHLWFLPFRLSYAAFRRFLGEHSRPETVLAAMLWSVLTQCC